MRQQSRLNVLVAAILAMAPLAATHADQWHPAQPTTGAVDPLRDDVNFISIAATGHFQRLAAMPKTGADERAMQRSPLALAGRRLHEEVNFVSLGTDGYFQQLAAMQPTTLQGYVSSQGHFTPFNPQATEARDAQESLWGIYLGGKDTP